MPALYQITGAMQALKDMDIDEQTLNDTLESLEMELNEKLAAIAKFCHNMEGDIEKVKMEQERLKGIRGKLENRVDKLKEYARINMIAVDAKQAGDAIAGFRIQNNPPRVVIDNNDAVPLSYVTQRVETVIDKNAIKQALQGGATVPGCHIEQQTGIRLR